MGEITSDSAKPVPEIGWVLELDEVFPGIDESFLCQILTSAEVAANAVGESANQGLIAPNDLSKGIPISLEAKFDQFRIFDRVILNGLHVQAWSGRKSGGCDKNLSRLFADRMQEFHPELTDAVKLTE